MHTKDTDNSSLDSQCAACSRLKSSSMEMYLNSKRSHLSKLSQDRENGLLEVQFRMIRCVYVDPHTNKRRFERLFGARVKHLRSNRGRVGVPTDEDKL
mmetsp:Transcript_6057/g.10819  ORF Transcript_6057/g.10819 Transcript_6057/m.10819 type:complete len:98 (+) Transcript_6057:130-423(+)